MWLLLVTTVAAAVFADAGYLYHVPNVSFRLSRSQPATFRPIPVLHNIEQDHKPRHKSLSYSVPYKEYAFLKKDNIANSIGDNQQLDSNYNNLHINDLGNNGRLLISHNVQHNLGGLLNNGYAGFAQSANNFNYNNAPSYVLPTSGIHDSHHHTVTPISVGASVGYAHSLPLHHNHPNARYIQHNPLVHPNIYNTRYIQTVSAPNNNNYFNLPVRPSEGPNLNDGYLYGTVPVNDAFNQDTQNTGPLNSAYSASLNDVYSQVAQASASLNNAYNQVEQVSASLNNAYNHVAQVSATVNDVQSHVETSSAEVNLNSGYTPSLIPSTAFDPYNGYSQFVPSPGNSINTGYNNNLVVPEEGKLNNGFGETASSGSQVNTAYKQSSSSAASTRTVFTPSQTTTSESSNIENSETSTGPTHIDLNADISQPSTAFAAAASSSLTSQTIDNNDATADKGLIQENLDAAVAENLRPGPASTTAKAPIIHKHVYFHVPPPDLEEPKKIIRSPTAPKKHYKILFIKVPSQESETKSTHLQQQVAQRHNAAVEDRTLIYLLVKTPQDPIPVVFPKTKPSEHQVFFVQYNGSPFEIASQVSQELEKTGSVKSIIPLEPRLINGQHK